MTLDALLTPELKAACQWAAQNHGEWSKIAELRLGLRDAAAALMGSEFRREHRDYEIMTPASSIGDRQFICLAGCNYDDPRHNYKWPDWQRAAEERLAK